MTTEKNYTSVDLNETTEAPAETKKTGSNARKVKKVKVKLPLLRGQKDQSVFVAVNGESYQIMRGVEVEVPYYIKYLLDKRERALDEADAYIASVAN